jgi:outer membrane protein TolC
MRSRLLLIAAMMTTGCASARPAADLAEADFEPLRTSPVSAEERRPVAAAGLETSPEPVAAQEQPVEHGVARVSFQPEPAAAPAATDEDAADPADGAPRPLTPAGLQPASPAGPGEPLQLDAVIGSVYASYPLLQAALFSRNIALGEAIAASGEFDLKIKGASENGPTGYYQTYRQSIGVVQPLYGGGEVFAGYRIGRGDFQPWYLERQTNDGGEFKAGVGVPLLQNVDIDPRRAALWNAQYGRHLAEPEIQAALIAFVREASYAYWDWVAAGASYHIAERVLRLAEDRTERIRSQVEAGLIDPPELTDNLRLVAERRAKVADAERKLQQTAVKLSLYRRDAMGRPQVPGIEQLPDFPPPVPLSGNPVSAEIDLALQQRPELKSLDWQRRQLEVDYAQADNMTLPSLDAVVAGSQDVGQATSKKKDKSEFEMEAGLFLDVPVQRRKARGKMTALEGKLAQISAKRRIVADKVAIDVQTATVALEAALTQVQETQEAVRLAEELAERERQNLNQGLSDLLKVTLREQYAAESAQKSVDALLLYYESHADLRAALGTDRLP